MFFGCDRMYSVTNMFMDLGLPSFKTILVNSRAVFGRLKIDCKNVVIHHVRLIGHWHVLVLYVLLDFFCFCFCLCSIVFRVLRSVGLLPEIKLVWKIDWIACRSFAVFVIVNYVHEVQRPAVRRFYPSGRYVKVEAIGIQNLVRMTTLRPTDPGLVLGQTGRRSTTRGHKVSGCLSAPIASSHFIDIRQMMPPLCC